MPCQLEKEPPRLFFYAKMMFIVHLRHDDTIQNIVSPNSRKKRNVRKKGLIFAVYAGAITGQTEANLHKFCTFGQKSLHK